MIHFRTIKSHQNSFIKISFIWVIGRDLVFGQNTFMIPFLAIGIGCVVNEKPSIDFILRVERQTQQSALIIERIEGDNLAANIKKRHVKDFIILNDFDDAWLFANKQSVAAITGISHGDRGKDFIGNKGEINLNIRLL